MLSVERHSSNATDSMNRCGCTSPTPIFNAGSYNGSRSSNLCKSLLTYHYSMLDIKRRAHSAVARPAGSAIDLCFGKSGRSEQSIRDQKLCIYCKSATSAISVEERQRVHGQSPKPCPRLVTVFSFYLRLRLKRTKRSSRIEFSRSAESLRNWFGRSILMSSCCTTSLNRGVKRCLII